MDAMRQPHTNTKLALLTVIVALASVAVACADKPDSASLRKAYLRIPVRVRALVEWANEGKAATPRNVDERIETLWARNDARRWITWVIDPSLLPGTDGVPSADLEMLERDDGCDIICAQWERNGLAFSVLQTSTIMTVTVAAESKQSDETGAGRAAATRLAGRVFRNHDEVLMPRGAVDVNVVESAGGSRAILLKALADGEVEELAGGYRGLPRRLKNAKGHKDRTWRLFWWRHVSWWSTPGTTVFYFPKVGGGPTAASYGYDEADRRWFEERTYHNKSGKRPEGK